MPSTPCPFARVDVGEVVDDDAAYAALHRAAVLAIYAVAPDLKSLVCIRAAANQAVAGWLGETLDVLEANIKEESHSELSLANVLSSPIR
jgi:hypothetical protein